MKPEVINFTQEEKRLIKLSLLSTLSEAKEDEQVKSISGEADTPSKTIEYVESALRKIERCWR